jgi:hypothetical protein
MRRRAKHRSRVARDPTKPNLRQVHLIHSELHEELLRAGFAVSAGQMGENVTTRGIDLLKLPVGTRLSLGRRAIVEVTGLRNPCYQLDDFQPGLKEATLGRDERRQRGNLVRKAGIMAVVLVGGEVRRATDRRRIAAGASPITGTGLSRDRGGDSALAASAGQSGQGRRAALVYGKWLRRWGAWGRNYNRSTDPSHGFVRGGLLYEILYELRGLATYRPDSRSPRCSSTDRHRNPVCSGSNIRPKTP